MYNCLLIFFYSFLIYNLLLLLQLQKATTETNRTKEDMKALQNDLSNADKEITVRNSILSTLLHFIYLLLLVSVTMRIFKGHYSYLYSEGFYRGVCSYNIHLDYKIFPIFFWQLTLFSELWSDFKSFLWKGFCIFNMLTKRNKNFSVFKSLFWTCMQISEVLIS